MDVVTVAVCIVAGLLAALAWLVMERIGAPAWVAAGVTVAVGLLAFAAGPGLLS